MIRNNIASCIFTQTTLEKGRQILYLVLKKKPFSEEIIEEVKNEVEKRLEKYILNILPKLENMKFKDPEQALKTILLHAIINILKEMMKEDLLKLTLNDLKVLDDLFKNEINLEKRNDDDDTNKNKKVHINKEKDKDKNKDGNEGFFSFLKIWQK